MVAAEVLDCDVEVPVRMVTLRADLVIPLVTVGVVDEVVLDVGGALEVVLDDFWLNFEHFEIYVFIDFFELNDDKKSKLGILGSRGLREAL